MEILRLRGTRCQEVMATISETMPEEEEVFVFQ